MGVPLEEINAQAAEAALQLNLSPESQTVLATLISAGGYWAGAAQSGDVPQWKALITGDTSKPEQFRAKVDGYLALAGVPDASTQVIQASFGLFGELPVIGVRLSDCYLLMDPTNGNLSGPFESSSPLDARGLLSFHADAYEAGKAVRYYYELGCPLSELPLAVWYPASPLGPHIQQPACATCQPQPLPPGAPAPPLPANRYPNPPSWNPIRLGYTACLGMGSSGYYTEVDQGTVTGPPVRKYYRIRYYDCTTVTPQPISGCPSSVTGCTVAREDTWIP